MHNENDKMSRARSGTPRSKRDCGQPAYCAEYRSVRGSFGVRRSAYSPRSGFTLIELLIVVGIITVLIALAIPAILFARKRGTETRIRADLNSIAQALDAYKADFSMQYPRFADPISDYNSAQGPVPGNGTWLDYSKARGAVLLCRALIGPGPANTSTLYPFPANPGDDGADGPGFRVRINAEGTNSTTGNPILTGKTYGFYIDPAKFNVQYLNAPTAGAGNGTMFQQAYPAIFEGVAGDWTDPVTGHQYKGSPILYYPAASGTYVSQQTGQVQVLSYTDPSTVNTSTAANAASRFNGFDNQYLLDSTSGGTAFSATSDFAQLAASAGSPDYLLWTAGSSGHFGLVNGKSDDITNFDLPGNLKK